MIGSNVKPANSYELGQLYGQFYTQLTLKVKPSMVMDIVEEISKKVCGCHTLFDGKNYVYTEEKCKTFRIPDNFPNLEETHLFVSKNHTLPMNDRLACICYNNDTVVLHGSHACHDGGYLKWVLDYLTGKPTPIDPCFKIHESLPDCFEKYFDKVSGKSLFYSTPVKSSPKLKENVSSIYRYIEFPLEKKIKGFTEHLMMSTLLTTSILNEKLSSFSIQCAFDSRRALPCADWRHVNMNTLTTVDAHIENPDKNVTIGDLKRNLRKDLEEKLTNGEMFRIARDYKYGTIDFPSYATQSISNIGNLQTNNEISDALISTSLHGPTFYPGCVSLGVVTVNKSIFKGRFFTSPYITSFREADKLAKSLEFAIKNIEDEMSIQEAFKLTKQIYLE
ncbi:hypothetical protein TVAG_281190 [Trichomonas vaginalis G3]|uniref:Alcohol acetyltransferase n=1 Tax=Trichomonas vaginalis (strain ATCC PRA-98 / G3) TaxID=412133 RepID=A2DRN9_TRIV3|nr:hypothetical protein TVAGG3_0696400 [Trichomonas vaginalis G3]EAY17002.1 hypothetical protein TVAG_281190 [Trichomonas vaginalis G3]KAI5508945.1 hypothetical protein TVAGG3_0696400 [Trichomonas vaginalis G3]|eukprot:XP_001329225.1 hypothetical protein [Trichomonas vaginalis G3]